MKKYFWGDATPDKMERDTRYILNTVMAALKFYRGVSHRLGFRIACFDPLSASIYLATERQKMGLVRMQAAQELLSEFQHPLPKVLHSLLERTHLELSPTPEGPTLTTGANTSGASTHSRRSYTHSWSEYTWSSHPLRSTCKLGPRAPLSQV